VLPPGNADAREAIRELKKEIRRTIRMLKQFDSCGPVKLLTKQLGKLRIQLLRLDPETDPSLFAYRESGLSDLGIIRSLRPSSLMVCIQEDGRAPLSRRFVRLVSRAVR